MDYKYKYLKYKNKYLKLKNFIGGSVEDVITLLKDHYVNNEDKIKEIDEARYDESKLTSIIDKANIDKNMKEYLMSLLPTDDLLIEKFKQIYGERIQEASIIVVGAIMEPKIHSDYIRWGSIDKNYFGIDYQPYASFSRDRKILKYLDFNDDNFLDSTFIEKIIGDKKFKIIVFDRGTDDKISYDKYKTVIEKLCSLLAPDGILYLPEKFKDSTEYQTKYSWLLSPSCNLEIIRRTKLELPGLLMNSTTPGYWTDPFEGSVEKALERNIYLLIKKGSSTKNGYILMTYENVNIFNSKYVSTIETIPTINPYTRGESSSTGVTRGESSSPNIKQICEIIRDRLPQKSMSDFELACGLDDPSYHRNNNEYGKYNIPPELFIRFHRAELSDTEMASLFYQSCFRYTLITKLEEFNTYWYFKYPLPDNIITPLDNIIIKKGHRKVSEQKEGRNLLNGQLQPILEFKDNPVTSNEFTHSPAIREKIYILYRMLIGKPNEYDKKELDKHLKQLIRYFERYPNINKYTNKPDSPELQRFLLDITTINLKITEICTNLQNNKLFNQLVIAYMKCKLLLENISSKTDSEKYGYVCDTIQYLIINWIYYTVQNIKDGNKEQIINELSTFIPPFINLHKEQIEQIIQEVLKKYIATINNGL